MKWQQMSQYRLESDCDYIISKSKVNENTTVYVARAPKVAKYIYSGTNIDQAKMACDDHFARIQP